MESKLSFLWLSHRQHLLCEQCHGSHVQVSLPLSQLTKVPQAPKVFLETTADPTWCLLPVLTAKFWGGAEVGLSQARWQFYGTGDCEAQYHLDFARRKVRAE